MVRLKVRRVVENKEPITEFQFHYGTIKSLHRSSYPVFPLIFQFHYGTIKRTFVFIIHADFRKFQFHYGTIKRRLVSRNYA